MRCTTRASNGPNHLGLCALQVPTDFDRMSGLNMKNSLIPHNMHTRPLRGEGNEESRRRILGMGGTIEAIRSEERTSLLFAARISKQGSEKPSVTLPPI